MHQKLQPSPSKISLALSIIRVENIPLTSHAVKCWDQEKDEVSLLQKTLAWNFTATDLGLQWDSYFGYPSICLDSAAACSRKARKRLFLPPLLISRQMNQRCVLSVFITLHYLPNAIFTFVTSHILFKPDTILTPYTSTSDITWPLHCAVSVYAEQ